MLRFALPACLIFLTLAGSAGATPVCTDGYKGGPPSAACGGRIFPEARNAVGYVQYTANPFGFSEYQHGIEYLAQKYPRWISVFTLKDRYGKEAVTAGADKKRPGEAGDTGGRDIQVIKITDHQVPDKGKETVFFSLSVHGNERGGLEGGLRTAEDLAMGATTGGKLPDGIDNYDSSTGRKETFRDREIKDVLAKEAIYLVDFNSDGWAQGDFFAPAPQLYGRGNSIGTDINRQMPTVGRINPGRNPLQESEANYGTRFMHDIAKAGKGELMAYGADVHGELNSQAYMDIMYPAGEFDSVDHRRLMSMAERTKSVIDKTLYNGIIEEKENATGGNDAEYARAIPVKPAHWATVWDTLGYTDTGFIGDYMATDLGVTGMDYEIMFNHTVPEKTWNVYLQENHITATRGIIKTAMAYALFQRDEFNDENVKVDPVGRAGYVFNPDTVTDKDENGVGRLPGPGGSGKGADGKPVAQRPYDVSNTRWFTDTSRLMPRPFFGIPSGLIAADAGALDQVDSLVLADAAVPPDPDGRIVNSKLYFQNLRKWVEKGGNLVLTDRALHTLDDLGVVDRSDIRDLRVYQPYANFTEAGFKHPMAKGLRPNARQLVETGPLGFGIGGVNEPKDFSVQSVVETPAWQEAKGTVIATSAEDLSVEGEDVSAGDPAIDKNNDNGSLTTVGETKIGKGLIRIVGGALPQPTEANDHRYGLRNYAMTYTGLFLMENSVKHDAPGLGTLRPGSTADGRRQGGAPAGSTAAADLAAARSVGLPSNARCFSRRRMTIAIKDPKGRETLKTVRIKLNGKTRRTIAGKALKTQLRRNKGVLIDMIGRTGKVRVDVVARTSRGRTITRRKTYTLCVKRKRTVVKPKSTKKVAAPKKKG